jgi:hypothetical protein
MTVATVLIENVKNQIIKYMIHDNIVKYDKKKIILVFIKTCKKLILQNQTSANKNVH